MGVKIGPLIKEKGVGREIDIKFLEGKVIAIDALPTIYEMLAVIRAKNGDYLRDSKGRITSHLVGLFNRTARMLAHGIKPIFVFDGPPHPLKIHELERRKKIKEEARKKLEEAKKRGDIDAIIKYAKQSMEITDQVLGSAMELLKLFGVPIIIAPHDAEAQCAYIVKKGDAYATASPDFDSFLYGSPRVIQNLKMSTTKFTPILYELKEVLEKLGLTYEQLVDMAILIGTDFNPGGVRGVGPKRAYELIRQYKSLERVLKVIRWEWKVPAEEIKKVFLNPSVTDNYKIEFKDPDYDGIIEFLVEEHDFNRQRVEKELEDVKRRLEKEKKLGVRRQVSLEAFFG